MEYLIVLDKNVLFWIQNHLVSNALNPYMLGLSKMGNAGIVWIIFGIVLLWVKKYRWIGVTVVLALAISLVLGNGILKPLVARLRPCVIYPWVPMVAITPMPTDYSFPSGHTFASFAAAVGVFCQSKRLGVAALLLATGIGFSRMYLFVHYPSDVLAGILLGTISGIIAYKMSLYLSISRFWLKVKILGKFLTSAHKD
ncbi:MAG: phosphatase PAP2 family protein [Selenomonadaceae bacterium]